MKNKNSIKENEFISKKKESVARLVERVCERDIDRETERHRENKRETSRRKVPTMESSELFSCSKMVNLLEKTQMKSDQHLKNFSLKKVYNRKVSVRLV